MDYQRIYREFIADRKAKPQPEGYSERHHILPRSLGGGDEVENLIILTAEDHFFAHLLLAKTHGGGMWAPVAFMVNGQRKDYKPIISRRAYGWAVEAMSKAMRGEGAHQFDWTVYRLEHDYLGKWRGKQSQFHELGISRSLGNMLIKGRVKSARGWYIEGHRPDAIGRGKPGALHNMADHQCYRFRHVDGRTFEGTQIEFRCATGVSKPGCTRLVHGTQTISKGWHLDGVTPKRNGRAGAYTR